MPVIIKWLTRGGKPPQWELLESKKDTLCDLVFEKKGREIEQSILAATPVKTGYLLSRNKTEILPHLLRFSNDAEYAKWVHDGRCYIAKGSKWAAAPRPFIEDPILLHKADFTYQMLDACIKAKQEIGVL